MGLIPSSKDAGIGCIFFLCSCMGMVFALSGNGKIELLICNNPLCSIGLVNGPESPHTYL
jgi:hypothetical protein